MANGTKGIAEGSFGHRARTRTDRPNRISRQRIKALLATIALIAAIIASGPFILPANATGPAIQTDKVDYAPGEIVHVSGSGFTPNAAYDIPVLRPDGSIILLDPVTHVATPGFGSAVADSNGALKYDYQLNGIGGTYEIHVYSKPWNGDFTAAPAASLQFTDNFAASDFKQCATGTTDPHTCDWINGIVQSSNSLYFEGMANPQRLLFRDIGPSAGDFHTLTFSVDATKAGIHAYDFMTSYAQAVTLSTARGGYSPALDLNPCGAAFSGGGINAGFCNGLRSSPNFVDIPIPSDAYADTTDGPYATRITAFETLFGPRTLRIYGNGAVNTIGVPSPIVLAHVGSDTADSEVTVTLTWHGVADDVLIEFAGHVAQADGSSGWGTGQGASSISGGPYHIQLKSLDGASTGSQDNQIKGADIRIRPVLATASNPTGNTTAGVLATDTATITGGATGTISFSLCGPAPLATAADATTGCPTGGTLIGAPVAIVGGTATSPATTAGQTALPGLYCWRADYTPNSNKFSATTHTNATSECFTVIQQTPGISTTSSQTGNVAPGSSVTDTATLTGTAGTVNGTVTFFLCGPLDLTAGSCPTGGTQIGSAVNLVAGVATSEATTGTADLGKYCWRAIYAPSAESPYVAVNHTNDTTECFTVVKQPSTTDTTSSPTGGGVAPGTSVTDSATVVGGVGQPTPSGSVSFFLCQPADVTAGVGCVSPAGASVGGLVALIAGAASSAASTNTTTIGKYCWRAEYSGDGFYLPSSHTNSGSECFIVEKKPSNTTTLSSPNATNVVPGTSVTDTATVTGSGPVPTGSVSFFLCQPADVTAGVGCVSPAGAPIGGAVTLSATGVATSSASTNTTAIGKYCWRAVYSGDGFYDGSSHTNSTTECFTVVAQPSQTVTGSNPNATNVVPGTSVTDTATITGSGPVPTGSVSFFLCQPADVTAAGCVSPAGSQVGAAVTLAAGVATSSASTSTTAIGKYCWRAVYSGDGFYDGSSHTNATTECFTTVKQPSNTATQSDPKATNVVPGTSVTDTATITGSGPTPTGTVTFFLCQPAAVTSAGCESPAGAQVGSNPVALSAAGTATSAASTNTTTVGKYCWRAVYSGDAFYNGSSHTNATSECFTTVKQPSNTATGSNPTSGGVVPGTSVTDTATITGAIGQPVPTGSVTFFLCQPADLTPLLTGDCSSGGTQVGANPVALAAGVATSVASTNTATVGKYCWRAEYSGDAFYNGSSHTNATSECFTTVKQPSNTATGSNPTGGGVVPGTSVTDTATITGGVGQPVPTGSVTFFLCQPADLTPLLTGDCSSGGTQVGANPVALSAAGVATSVASTNTATVGKYCWRAEYSGDAFYNGSSHTNATSECFTTVKQPSNTATNSSPGGDIAFGSSVKDVATISGSVGQAGGTVKFFLCQPSELTPLLTGDCSSGGTQIGGAITLAAGSATSASSANTNDIGKYCWRAEYSGDDLYLPSTHTNSTTECFWVAKLIVIKHVVNDNGGALVASNFTLSVTGASASPASLPGAESPGTAVKVVPGTYSVTEPVVPSGYLSSFGADCSGTIVRGTLTTCTVTNDDQPGKIVIKKVTKPAGSSASFTFETTVAPYAGFSLTDGQSNTQTLNAGTYTAKELVTTGWVLTGIGGSTNPNTPTACTVEGTSGSSGSGSLATQTATITLKIGDTVTCVFENTGQGTTRTQGFWSTHSPLANIAWFGGTAFGHTFPGVAGVPSIGDRLICGRELDTLGKVTGAFWSNIAKKSTGAKRSPLDQARMTLLQQLIAAELNASAFGSSPTSGSFAAWESALCGTDITAIKTAQSQAASFNEGGDSGLFTPGTSADSKNARAIANLSFWDFIA